MTACQYDRCRMVNLCKRHCVRKAMENDGWDYVNGEFQLRTDAKSVAEATEEPSEMTS